MIKKLTPNINVQLLGCTRGNKALYSNVNFTLEPGDAIQIQGPNGCGKTSLLKQFCQIIPTYDGEISINKEKFFSMLLYSGHSPAIKRDLTCFENIKYMGLLDGVFDESLLEEGIQHLLLSESKDTLGSDLSRGQSQKTALSRLFFELVIFALRSLKTSISVGFILRIFKTFFVCMGFGPSSNESATTFLCVLMFWIMNGAASIVVPHKKDINQKHTIPFVMMFVVLVSQVFLLVIRYRLYFFARM